jgi:hypothetical protein
LSPFEVRNVNLLLLLLGCLVPSLAYAQSSATELRPDSTTQRLTYAEQVLMPGVSQADLTARAQAWLVTAYQTTRQPASPSTGVVQGTGWREIERRLSREKSTPLSLWYRVTIIVQPARYRYTISDFQLQPEPTTPSAGAEKQAIESVLGDATVETTYRQQAEAAAQGIAETIKVGMNTSLPPSQKQRR